MEHGSGQLVAPLPPAIPQSRVVQTARFLTRPVPFLERQRNELGETFSARLLGPGDLVFITDPESIKRLFSADRVNTIAPGRTIVLRPLLGTRSLLLQENDEHLRRRKLMLPPFHGERMRAYERTIVEATERAISTWPVGSPFPLHPSMQAITLDVILRAVFGVEDAGRREELRRSLVAILGTSASPAAIGLTVPALRRIPPYRRFARLVARANEALVAEIDERRRDPSITDREDILSMLVAARFEDGSQMDRGELRDQLMTLLLAGHETTATGLAWTFDLLLHNPGALARLLDGLDDDDDDYVGAVVDESLRLRPVVPMTGRELREPAALGGHALDAGTVVMVAIYLAHTRADAFPEPYAFRPERFVEGRADTYSWIPFGGGTRRCLGAAFAQFEMAVVLRTVLRNVALEAASASPEPVVRRNVTLSPRNGTPVRVVERRHSVSSVPDYPV